MRTEMKEGERIVAFFDLDGTLIPEPSLENRFFVALRRNGEIPPKNYLLWSLEALRLLPHGILAMQHANKRYLTGVCGDLACRYVESLTFFDEGVERMEWHVRKGHEIVLLTGTLEPLARLAAMALECELEARGVSTRLRICATQLEEERGRWTGRVNGEALFAQAKARALEKFAREEHLDLRQCHGYGNSLADRYFLSAVGHAHAVNVGRDMAAIANVNDWAIWHWHLARKIESRETENVAAEIQEIGEQV